MNKEDKLVFNIHFKITITTKEADIKFLKIHDFLFYFYLAYAGMFPNFHLIKRFLLRLFCIFIVLE